MTRSRPDADPDSDLDQLGPEVESEAGIESGSGTVSESGHSQPSREGEGPAETGTDEEGPAMWLGRVDYTVRAFDGTTGEEKVSCFTTL
jgi:hypothetical protein